MKGKYIILYIIVYILNNINKYFVTTLLLCRLKKNSKIGRIFKNESYSIM